MTAIAAHDPADPYATLTPDDPGSADGSCSRCPSSSHGGGGVHHPHSLGSGNSSQTPHLSQVGIAQPSSEQNSLRSRSQWPESQSESKSQGAPIARSEGCTQRPTAQTSPFAHTAAHGSPSRSGSSLQTRSLQNVKLQKVSHGSPGSSVQPKALQAPSIQKRPRRQPPMVHASPTSRSA